MNTEHRQQKISFWHSMKTQFIAVVILVAAVIVIIVYTYDYAWGKKQYPQYLFRLSAGSFHFVWKGDGKCHAGKY